MEAHFMCWNGPCEDRLITDCPMDATVGTACAVPWKTVTGQDRYAVYILLERPETGARGLVYEKSYNTPSGAQRRVEFLSYAVRQTLGVGDTN